jgi:hypothetical protein
MPRHASSHLRELEATERRRRVAAILALGVARYRHAAAGGTDGESTANRPSGLEVVSETRLSMTELARLGHVSQPRMSQILNLTLLAPDIQEALLCLPRVATGKAAIHERMLRPIAAETDWARQREMWTDYCREGAEAT